MIKTGDQVVCTDPSVRVLTIGSTYEILDTSSNGKYVCVRTDRKYTEWYYANRFSKGKPSLAELIKTNRLT